MVSRDDRSSRGRTPTRRAEEEKYIRRRGYVGQSKDEDECLFSAQNSHGRGRASTRRATRGDPEGQRSRRDESPPRLRRPRSHSVSPSNRTSLTNASSRKNSDRIPARSTSRPRYSKNRSRNTKTLSNTTGEKKKGTSWFKNVFRKKKGKETDSGADATKSTMTEHLPCPKAATETNGKSQRKSLDKEVLDPQGEVCSAIDPVSSHSVHNSGESRDPPPMKTHNMDSNVDANTNKYEAAAENDAWENQTNSVKVKVPDLIMSMGSVHNSDGETQQNTSADDSPLLGFLPTWGDLKIFFPDCKLSA